MPHAQTRRRKMQHGTRTLRLHTVPPPPSAAQHASDAQDKQVSVIDRIPTQGYPVMFSKALTPPLFTTARAGGNADDTGDAVASPPSLPQQRIVIRVNMHASSSPYYRMSLRAAPANNDTMLRSIITKAASDHGVTFPKREILPGLVREAIQVRPFSRAHQDEQKAKWEQATTTAAAAAGAVGVAHGDVDAPPSSSPSPSRSIVSPPLHTYVHSHQFVLRFDSLEHSKQGYAMLQRMKLTPRVTSDRIITGKVRGFTFTATPEDVHAHLQKHAWYEKGAPSLRISLIPQSRTRMDANEPDMMRDDAYFYVHANEYAHVLTMPRMGSPHVMTWARYTRSDTTVCFHCHKKGHTSSQCVSRERKDGEQKSRGACNICSSFTHVAADCPSRDVDIICSICSGKHRVVSCPKYLGTYTVTQTQQQRQAQNNKRQRAWDNGAPLSRLPQGQQQQQQQQQPQQQQQQQQQQQLQQQHGQAQEQEQKHAHGQEHTRKRTRADRPAGTEMQELRDMMKVMIASQHSTATRVTSMAQELAELKQQMAMLLASRSNNNSNNSNNSSSSASNNNNSSNTSTAITSSGTPVAGRAAIAMQKAAKEHGASGKVSNFFQPIAATSASTSTSTSTLTSISATAAATTTATAETTTAAAAKTPDPSKKHKRARTDSADASADTQTDTTRMQRTKRDTTTETDTAHAESDNEDMSAGNTDDIEIASTGSDSERFISKLAGAEEEKQQQPSPSPTVRPRRKSTPATRDTHTLSSNSNTAPRGVRR